MQTELESRIGAARPAVPDPSPLVARRVRGAAVAAVRRRSRRRVAVFVAAALSTVLVGGPAYALLDPFEGAPVGTWTWPGGVPGRSIELDPPVRKLVALPPSGPGIDVSTTREVISVGSGLSERGLLAARAADGELCFSATLAGAFGAFGCPFREHLFRGGGLTLPTEPPPSLRAVLYWLSVGGAHPRVVDRATIVGIARSDVTRVVVRVRGGAERELPLNEWRAFSYAADRPDELPTALVAFRRERRWVLGSEEVVLENVVLEAHDVGRSIAPLCGGASGPCDPELEKLVLK